MKEDQTPSDTVVVKSKLLGDLMEQLRKQGILFVVLAVGIWYIQAENKKLQAEIKECYQESSSRMIEVVSNNTRALDRIILHHQWDNRSTQK